MRASMRSLISELSTEFGPLGIYRPNRDVRFSHDKSPHKLWTGATSESRALGGIGNYLEASATGLVTGYGAMLMAPDQLRRFRAAAIVREWVASDWMHTPSADGSSCANTVCC